MNFEKPKNLEDLGGSEVEKIVEEAEKKQQIVDPQAEEDAARAERAKEYKQSQGLEGLGGSEVEKIVGEAEKKPPEELGNLSQEEIDKAVEGLGGEDKENK